MADIHFSNVPQSVRQELVELLNPSGSKNWKDLGEKLNDYQIKRIEYIVSLATHEKACAELMFDDYSKRPDATVGRMREALKDMEREDCVAVLDANMAKIEHVYKTSLRNQQMSPHLMSPNRQPIQHSCQWTNKYNPVTTSMCSSCGPDGYMQHPSHTSLGYRAAPQAHMGINHSPPSCRVTHHGLQQLDNYQHHNGHPHPHPHPHPYHSGHYDHGRRDAQTDSMVVQDLSLRPDDPMDVDMGDVHHSQDAVPLPQGIMRGDHHFMPYDESLAPIDVHHRSGDQIDYHNLSSRSAHTAVRGRPGYFQQHSEENNARQPVTQKRDVGSRSPASPPISKLQKLAYLPAKYQPDQNYKNFVAEQKVDDDHYRTRAIKEEKIEFPETSGYSHGGKRNGTHEKPRTFPRVKSPLNSVTGGFVNGQHNSLSKSSSMPVNMKPSEFRRGFSYIRVFVTYSNDNKKHLQKVLSLCNCIVKNGFSCIVDVNNRYVSTLPNHQDRVLWYKDKFKESDFILVCPSQKYQEETQGQEGRAIDTLQDDQLHTRLIYRLMHQEFQSQGKNSRFVPVLFDGISEDLLPAWLKTSLKYRWPSQYKDLLWMLTKPEDRVKPKVKSYSEANSHSNSPKHEAPY